MSRGLTELLTIGKAEPLPEAVDPSMTAGKVPEETDNLGLVEAGKRSMSGIVVTIGSIKSLETQSQESQSAKTEQ